MFLFLSHTRPVLPLNLPWPGVSTKSALFRHCLGIGSVLVRRSFGNQVLPDAFAGPEPFLEWCEKPLPAGEIR